VGFQEPFQLLQVWEKKACRQWEFQCLISCMGLREHSSLALLLMQESKAFGQQKF
jgi:hypothetical protein